MKNLILIFSVLFFVIGCFNNPSSVISSDQTQEQIPVESVEEDGTFPIMDLDGKAAIQADDKETAKEEVMKSLRKDLAKLAHRLGYAWAGGNDPDNGGGVVGEDFKRMENGYGYEANYIEGGIGGFQADQRLKIVFTDWTFHLREIEFDTPTISTAEPKQVSTSAVDNMQGETDVVRRFSVDINRTKTTTHSKSKSFNWGNETMVSAKVGVPFFNETGVQNTLSFGGEETNGYVDSETETVSTSELVVAELPHHSEQEYSVVVTETKSSVNYTALMEVRFNVEFHGFLRYQDDHGNYHNSYRESRARPTVVAKIGGPERSFMDDLRHMQENSPRPWLWEKMMNEHHEIKEIIESLQQVSRVTFPVNGQYEMVDGSHTEIQYGPIVYNEDFWKTELDPQTEVPNSGRADEIGQCNINSAEQRKEFCLDPLFDPTGSCCFAENGPSGDQRLEVDRAFLEKPACTIDKNGNAIVRGLNKDIKCLIRTDKIQAVQPLSRSSSIALKEASGLEYIELYRNYQSTNFCTQYIGYIKCSK